MRCGREGWNELEEDDLERAEQIELWEYVASGDTKSARAVVAEVLGVDDEDICGVDMVADPCELLTDWACYRVWYKECPR